MKPSVPGENPVFMRRYSPQLHMYWPGIEYGHPSRETGDKPPKPRHSPQKVLLYLVINTE